MKCPNCGKDGPHLAPPSMGEPGFYICDRSPDHIKVELDFVPVVERLPVSRGVYFVLRDDEDSFYVHGFTKNGWANAGMNAGSVDHITHWAEIPKTKGAESRAKGEK